MKYVWRLLLIPIWLPLSSMACDICGCGAGNNYIGILPDFQKHITGIRYRSNTMLTHLGVGGTTTYLTTREQYNTAESWTGWNINPKMRLLFSVPVSFNEKTNQGITYSKAGLGDISLTGFYQLLNSRKKIQTGKLLVQSLWAGGGIKLPTGKYNPSDKSATGINTNLFQLGTGSYDLTLNIMYDIRLQDAGLNINTGYKINTANTYGYRYGNKLNATLQAYHKFRIRQQWMLAPNLGLQYEQSGTDRDGSVQVTASAGSLLLGTIGLEGGRGKITWGANWQTPLGQQMAKGIVLAQNRFMLHTAISL